MTTEILREYQGTRARITSLDECGNVTAESVYVSTKGFIKATLTAEVETGKEFTSENADGDYCINKRAPDKLKRIGVNIEWCEVNPDIINIITGFPVELDGTDVVGYRIETGKVEATWALELWTRLAEGACGEEGACYGYHLIPFITGATITGDQSVENEVATFSTSGYTVEESGWGVGPYDVIGDPAGPLDVPIGSTQIALVRKTCVAPPDVTDEATPVTPSSP